MTKNKIIFIVGIVFYVLSLFLPVWSCAHDTELSGLNVLTIGFMGLLVGDPRWLCNVVVITATYSLALNQPVLKIVSVCCAILAVTTLFGPYLCGAGGGALGYGSGPSYGNLFWVLSISLLTVSICLTSKTVNKSV